MRTIFVPPLNRNHSVLGFGCASLGSRISPKQGETALALAFERGITWYDVAPPYGDGRAEALLGAFLKGRRDQVAICTKAGIPRSHPRFYARALRPAVRLALKALPHLRRSVAQMRGPEIQVNMPAPEIEKSVVESLRLLQTDYIDVLALHEPSIAMCEAPATLEMLEKILQKGYVRCVSIAGSRDAIIAGSSVSPLYQFAQFQDNPFLEMTELLRQRPATQNLFFITHSVFGTGTLERFTDLVQKSSMSSQLAASSIHLLFDYALAKNQNGIVLSSMFSQRHIEQNCARASAPVNNEAVALVTKLCAFTPSQAA
jgi:aryl-alcohol dehydrogenase-like predicted oxidoreductase